MTKDVGKDETAGAAFPSWLIQKGVGRVGKVTAPRLLLHEQGNSPEPRMNAPNVR